MLIDINFHGGATPILIAERDDSTFYFFFLPISRAIDVGITKRAVGEGVLNPDFIFRSELEIVGVSVADIPVSPTFDRRDNKGDVFEVGQKPIFISAV